MSKMSWNLLNRVLAEIKSKLDNHEDAHSDPELVKNVINLEKRNSEVIN